MWLLEAGGLKRMRAEVTRRFEEAVENAKRAPQPTLADLETDVFAEKEVA